jgi:hypothetical protein
VIITNIHGYDTVGMEVNMGRKRQLPQIRLFSLEKYRDFTEMEKDVNNFVIEAFSKDGNTPSIDVSSNYITVTRTTLVNTRYEEYHQK